MNMQNMIFFLYFFPILNPGVFPSFFQAKNELGPPPTLLSYKKIGLVLYFVYSGMLKYLKKGNFWTKVIY